MRATVLADNIGTDSLKGQWGLSIYINYGGRNILLDAGASGLFAENAGALGLKINDVDCAVLSHAHYDHADGMNVFFENNSKAKFYLRDGSGENCYRRILFYNKYIGIKKGTLQEFDDRIEYVSGDYELFNGAYLIPHKTPGLAEVGKRNKMYVKDTRSKYAFDAFEHEQSLVLETPDGLVIFNSCSHGGADNIIKEVQATFPQKKIKAIVGGFHLFGKPAAEVRALAKRMKDTGISSVYTGHCTGKGAYEILKEELGDIVQQLHVGLEIEL